MKGASPGFHDLGMMAMSSWKNTFIVGIYPEVRNKCVTVRPVLLFWVLFLNYLTHARRRSRVCVGGRGGMHGEFGPCALRESFRDVGLDLVA